jgi:hypothetical protein
VHELKWMKYINYYEANFFREVFTAFLHTPYPKREIIDQINAILF